MTDMTPVELIVAAYPTEQGADDTLAVITEAKKEHLVKIRAAATVRRDVSGKLHIKERGDLSTGGGAASGAAVGAVLGLFGGPVGALLGGAAGAAIGGLAGKLIDTGVPDERLRQIGASLTNGSSAVVALIELSFVDELRRELTRAGGDLVTAGITSDISAQLAAGKEVAYRALSGERGTAVIRSAGDEHTIDVEAIAADAQGNVAALAADASDAVGDAVDGAKKTAGEATAAVKDAASDAAAATTKAAGDAVDGAKKMTGEATAAVKDAAGDAVDAAKRAVS